MPQVAPFYTTALLLQYFQYFLQLIYLLTFFCFYNFYNLNTYQNRFVTFILGFQINTLSHTPLSINSFTRAFILHLSSFQRCLLLKTLLLNLHLHLHVSCHSMRLVSLVPDTRLNNLKFKFFTTSGTHNFAHGFCAWII